MRQPEKMDSSKAAGHDGIHSAILKQMAGNMVKTHTQLLNASLDEGPLPVDWLTSTVKPAQKGGGSEYFNRYTAMSLTTIALVAQERLICQKRVKKLET